LTMGELVRELGLDDPFLLYRRFLVIFCSIYTSIRLCQSLWRWVAYLFGPGRSRRLMREYLAVLLLRTRWRRFFPQYLQIAALFGIMLVLIWLHSLVGANPR